MVSSKAFGIFEPQRKDEILQFFVYRDLGIFRYVTIRKVSWKARLTINLMTDQLVP